ncbi:hypothetical protein [Candidatus Neoehrlichia procyonis]|uniref:Uncharacterized protein n=1 Tax=Candidatus Neoehrlichia procyonis str. RAC413 TaxID=1359163 RepID=A0A0F3NNM6_9RICK|nr:hypothetical protein [Candidatus Neoehrlichia lotoris]KJV69650.1 hypothetical protein NLO413_1050 [Candidatus Neoehrlichia lotoris str. RAC413]
MNIDANVVRLSVVVLSCLIICFMLFLLTYYSIFKKKLQKQQMESKDVKFGSSLLNEVADESNAIECKDEQEQDIQTVVNVDNNVRSEQAVEAYNEYYQLKEALIFYKGIFQYAVDKLRELQDLWLQKVNSKSLVSTVKGCFNYKGNRQNKKGKCDKNTLEIAQHYDDNQILEQEALSLCDKISSYDVENVFKRVKRQPCMQ